MTKYLLISANAILNILVICVSLFLLYLIVCFIATAHLFKLTFKRNEKAATQRNPIYNKYKDLLEEGEKYFFSLSPEEITLTSFDNLKLFAYFYNNPQAKGVFFGIELKHERAHFARAIMESVAYMIKEYVDFMGVDVSEIRSMGGGAKSDLWCNIKSQVLDKTITTLKENETACLGSAIFAGLSIGVFDNITSACDQLVIKNKSYFSTEVKYQKHYKDYKQKELKLLEIF